MRKKLMEVAEACMPKPKPVIELSRDETLVKIGEITSDIHRLRDRANLIAAQIEPLVEELDTLRLTVEVLQEEKLALEASIHKVTRVDIRAVRKRKAKPKTELEKLKEQIHNKILNMTPEEIANLKEKGLL